uniref:Uncharacterized protein n=1 Tax=Lactuca sativa TaxID=4236 RepID=A0A9R1VB43_LACSA|nr:hypothetical protein LSAT_V11C600326670 [Lactuca sativa]
MEEMGKLNPQARKWLEGYPLDRWTLAHDGERRCVLKEGDDDGEEEQVGGKRRLERKPTSKSKVWHLKTNPQIKGWDTIVDLKLVSSSGGQPCGHSISNSAIRANNVLVVVVFRIKRDLEMEVRALL